MSSLHTKATLQIYSELFKYPKDENSDYWYDLFNLSIMEPALIATFKSVTSHDYETSSVFFKRCTDCFFENCEDNFENKFLLNNLILIMNAYFRALKEKQDLVNIIFNNNNKMNEKNTEILNKFLKMIQTGLNEDSLVKSSLNLLMNFILVIYKIDELFEKLIKTDLTILFSDNVLHNENLSKFDYNRYFIILGVLVSNSKFKDVENNVFKRYLQDVENQIDFNTINRYLKSITSFNLIILDDLKPDLLIQKSTKSSFFNLITFNVFNKFNYNYSDLKSELDSELNILLKMKLQKIKENNNCMKEVNLVESISLNLILFTLIINNSKYCDILTEENEDEGSDIHFFDLFLSYSTFILQNQNNNKVNHFNSRLILLIFNKLLRGNDDKSLINILGGSIDQFKYKLCHQTEPILNNLITYQDLKLYDSNYEDFDLMEENQFKFKIFYVLDILQCFLRYNLTSNIDSISYKLSLGNVFLILQILLNNYDQAVVDNDENNYIKLDEFLFEYNWNDLFLSLLNLLKFLNNDKVVSKKLKKKNINKYYSIIEETFIILSLLLIHHEQIFKYGNYLIEFLYKLLEFHKIIINISIRESYFCQFVLSIIYYLLIKFNIAKGKVLIIDKITFGSEDTFSQLNFDDLAIIEISENTTQTYLFAIQKIIEEVPLNQEKNKLIKDETNYEDLNSIIENSVYKNENFKYLKTDIANNYKVNLINDSITFLFDNFNDMFK